MKVNHPLLLIRKQSGKTTSAYLFILLGFIAITMALIIGYYIIGIFS